MYRIYTTNQAIDKCAKYNQRPYIAFIVYVKAFDSLNFSIHANTTEPERRRTVYKIMEISTGSTASICSFIMKETKF